MFSDRFVGWLGMAFVAAVLLVVYRLAVLASTGCVSGSEWLC